MQLSFEEKYNAIGRRESFYEGIFVTAVITTGIFCRPSCRAKKPKAVNVIFYETAQLALLNGFRPCKICKPMSLENDMPAEIKSLLDDLNENPFLRIKDCDLQLWNVDPVFLRRW